MALLSLVSSTFFGRLVIFADSVIVVIVVEDSCGVPDVATVKVTFLGVGVVVVTATSAVNVTGTLTSGRSEMINSLSPALSTSGISLLANQTVVGSDVGMTYVVFSSDRRSKVACTWMRVVVYW